MKGLLKKDFLLAFKSWPVMLGILVIATAIMAYLNATVGLLSFIAIFFLMQGVASIITDRTSGWNLYQTTFPISRSRAITEKYLFSLICGLAGFGLGFLICLCFGSAQEEALLVSSLLGGILGLSAMSVGIPLLLALPKNAFPAAIFAGFIPGAFCVVLWNQELTRQSALVQASQGAIAFNMRTDLLWIQLACMAGLCLVSWIVTPMVLSRKDQR